MGKLVEKRGRKALELLRKNCVVVRLHKTFMQLFLFSILRNINLNVMSI